MAYGGQSWLRRRPIDSFFPPCCCEPGCESGDGSSTVQGQIDATKTPDDVVLSSGKPDRSSCDCACPMFFLHWAKAVEEICGVYLDAVLHGSPPPRSGDRPWRFLPKACCRQRQGVDAGALVA